MTLIHTFSGSKSQVVPTRRLSEKEGGSEDPMEKDMSPLRKDQQTCLQGKVSQRIRTRGKKNVLVIETGEANNTCLQGDF